MVFSNRPFTDEAGFDLLIAKNIVVNHIFPLAGFNLNYEWHIMKGPGWNYTLAIPFFLGGGNLITAKIFTVIVQLAAIVISFFSLKSFFNLKTAFITSFLLSISPWFIDQSAFIWPPFIAPFFVVLFIVSLICFLKGDKRFSLLIALSLGLIGQYEVAITIFLLAQVLIFLPIWFKQKLINIKYTIYSLLVFLLTLTPVIAYDLTHNFYSSRGFLILFSKLLEGGGELNFFEKLIQRIDTFTWGFRSTFAPNIYISVLVFIILILAIYHFIKNKKITVWKKRLIIFLLAAPLLKFVFSFFYPGAAMAWHYLDLNIFYCFLAGIVLSSLDKKSLRDVSYFVFLILFILFSIRTINVYKNQFQFSLSQDSIKQSSVIKYIFKDSKGEPFTYKVYSYSLINTDFEYLFWYYSTKEYKNQKYNSGENVYLIFENRAIKSFEDKFSNEKVIKTFPDYTLEKLKVVN